MNREDVSEVVTAALGVSDISSVLSVDVAGQIALIVLSVDLPLTEEGSRGLQGALDRALKGTPLEGVRCAVLPQGLALHFFDASGQLLGDTLPQPQKVKP